MLSVCMIAKNEEAWLADCLAHLKPLNPEVILVDTGSTDSTKRIAQSFGAKIFERPWDDDFSAPRNLSLQFATQPWILSIDPDERIAPRDFPKLVSLLQSTSPVKAYAIQTRNYVRREIFGTSYLCEGQYSEEKDYPFFFLSSKIRLFRNFLGIKFKGVVHETLTDSVVSVCRPGEFQEADFFIHHYGTDPIERQKKNKQSLYRKLTEKKVSQEPNNPEAFIEFGKECLAAKDSDRALAAFQRAVQLDPQSPYYILELVRAHFRLGKGNQTAPLIDRGLQLEPGNPEFKNFQDQLSTLERGA